MRNALCLTLLTILLTALSGTSWAAEQGSFGTLNSGISLFAASDDEAGLEAWRSDGTAAGTFRLTDDACNDYCEEFNYFFAPWIEAGNRAFIYAQENDVSTLWVTDGSRDGTFPVFEGTTISNLQRPVWVKRLKLLFFVVQVASTPFDYELWRSDGTPEGTRKVKTFVSADTRPGVQELTEFQGRAFFNGQDPEHGPALWTSDGTEAGTVLVRNFVRDEEGAGPTWLRAVGSRLVFAAPSPSSGTMLWASDGTRAGTRQLQPLQIGGYASIHDARVVGKYLFLSVERELWISDGTRAGTRSLGTFTSPPALSLESLFKGRYYFESRTDEFDWEVWSTDGTRAGTRMLLDICPRGCSGVSPENRLAVVGGRLLFTAANRAHGTKLWQSDGTAQGTRMIQSSATPGYQRMGSGPVHLAGGRILFSAADSALSVPQLWRTDGTKNGTVRLTNVVANGVTDELIGEIPGALLFRVTNESGLDQLWVSNGTGPGTRLLKTIRAGG